MITLDKAQQDYDERLIQAFKISQYYKAQVEKLKALILFVDESMSSELCGTPTQLKQWTEFIRCFPKEGGANDGFYAVPRITIRLKGQD